MQKANQLSYDVQGVKINPYTIQLSYDQAKQKGKTITMLTNTFHLLKLAHQNRQDSSLHAHQIKTIADAHMLNQPESQSQNGLGPSLTLDMSKSYPLSKVGSLGTLVRDCRIVNEGLEEKEGTGKPKIKEVKGFINVIEAYNPKSKPKLQWIKDSTKYPFRIIVEGAKQEQKAIYFEDRGSAEQVRVYLVNKFSYKGNLKRVEAELKQKRKIALYESFRNQLRQYNEEKKKNKDQQGKLEMSESRKSFPSNNEAPSSASKANYSVREFEQNLINRSSIPKSQQGYDRNMMDFLIDKDEARKSIQMMKKDQINFGTVLKLERLYKKNFFQRWVQLSQSQFRHSVEKDTNRMKSIREGSVFEHKSQTANKSVTNKPSSLHSSPRKSVISQRKPAKISFKNIEFLKEKNIFLKPIIHISVFKSETLESESIFNTSIKSRDPHLSYELMFKAGKELIQINGDIKTYEIRIKAIDYLSNSVICDEKIPLKTKVLSEDTLLSNEMKEVRMQINYDSGRELRELHLGNNEGEERSDGGFLEFKPLEDKYVLTIRKFWDEESGRRGFFNSEKEMKIFEILEKTQAFPNSWAVNLTEFQFDIVQLINSASKILNFTLLPSILPITRVLQKFYSESEELVEATLSLITNYLSPYYFPSEFTRLQKIHRDLGLEGEIQFSSKVSLEQSIIAKLIEVECSKLWEALCRKNIAYSQFIYECIYEFYARAFPVKTLAQIWNFCFQSPELIQVYGILIGVWLMKFYEQKLSECENYKDFTTVVLSEMTCPSDEIIKSLLILREKYFTRRQSSKDKTQFENRILDGVVIEFYRRETKKIDARKEERAAEKELILQRLNTEVREITLPAYPFKEYYLHLYFYKFPSIPGSFYLKANGIEYECRDYTNKRYFILESVNTEVTVEFVNNKSDEFVGKLMCLQGVGKYQVELKSAKQKEVYKIEYLCGLVTDDNIESIKKNRKFQNILGSFVKQEQIFESFTRFTNQSIFLNTTATRLDRDDVGKKVKVIFSSGNKTFNEVDFYLRWIASCGLTLREKMELVKEYARNISLQNYLCWNQQVEKIFLSKFIQLLGFPLSQSEYDCYCSNSLGCEINSSKILKCKLILPNGTEFSVQKSANHYFSQRSSQYVYGDLLINELLESVQEELEGELNNISEGTFQIIVSTNGNLRNIEYPIVRRKTSKQLIVDLSKIEENENLNQLQTAEPEILRSQVIPGMQKNKSILSFTEGGKGFESSRNLKSPTKRSADLLNILHTCHEKLSKVIMFRNNEHPSTVKIPFLNYYHELISHITIPHVPKNIFLNNSKIQLKNILCSEFAFNFSHNKRMEPQIFHKKGEFYSNFRAFDSKVQSLHFSERNIEESLSEEPNALIFIYYGFGVYRWQPCFVKGFIEKKREGKSGRKFFIVNHRNAELFVEESEIQIDEEILEEIIQLELKPKIGSIKKGEKFSSKKSGMSSGGKRVIF